MAGQKPGQAILSLVVFMALLAPALSSRALGAPTGIIPLDPNRAKIMSEPTPTPSQEGISEFLSLASFHSRYSGGVGEGAGVSKNFPSLAGADVSNNFPSLEGLGAGSQVWRVSASLTLDPFTLPITPAPAGSSDLAPLLGVNIHFTRDERGLDAARAAGFRWVRMDLLWAQIETEPGCYNFAAYDGLLADLEARGMRALLILDYGNALYTGAANMPPVTSAAIQAFGDFAEAAARHFVGRGVRYEIWNEPNNDIFWPPAPDAEQFAALAADTAERVHAGDPAAEVTVGGLSGMDKMFLFKYLLAGGAAEADAIGCHPYRESGPETAIDDVIFWRALVAQMLPYDPPSWVTEWGYSSAWFGAGHSAGARTKQAIMASREILTAWMLGFPLIIYYDLRDDGNDGSEMEHNFGLLQQDYGDKPAMQALRTLSSAAGGRSYAGRIQLGANNLYAMRLDGANEIVVALWASEGQNTVLVASGVAAFTLLGEPLALQSNGTQQVCTVSESSGPVYLLFPRSNSFPCAVGSGQAVGDYDGDRLADPASFIADTGCWTVWMSDAGYAATTVANFLGQAGDIAAVADYDGDGLADPAVYRPAQAILVARLSSTGYSQVELSLATDAEEIRVLPADYDGDHFEDPALYATLSGRWFLWLSGAGYARSCVTGFGMGEDQPLAADFDGDYRADPACYTADGTWYFWLSGNNYMAAGPFSFGFTNATPVVGDFDGDGLADPGVVVSNSAWHVWLSSDQYGHYGPVNKEP